jgi:hypothetical protein
MHNHHHGPCGCRPPQHPLHVGELKYSAEQINELLDQIPKKANRSELHGFKGGFQADEEDLTERSGKIKFKDRDTSKGKGFIILRTGKSLTEQMTQENTIYEVRYDFDLNGEILNIPTNSILKFNGGTIINGTVNGDNSIIEANYGVFNNITFGGTWAQREVYAEWFRVGNITDSEIINKAVDFAYNTSINQVALAAITYNMNAPIYMKSNLSIKGAFRGTVLNAVDGATIITWSGLKEFCEISYIKFTGYGGKAIYKDAYDYPSTWHIHHCDFDASLEYCIVGNFILSHIENCCFGYKGTAHENHTHIIFKGNSEANTSNANKIADCRFYKSTSSYSCTFDSGYGLLLIRNNFELCNNTSGVIKFSGFNTFEITQCWFEQCTGSKIILLNNNEEGYAMGNYIVNFNNNFVVLHDTNKYIFFLYGASYSIDFCHNYCTRMYGKYVSSDGNSNDVGILTFYNNRLLSYEGSLTNNFNIPTPTIPVKGLIHDSWFINWTLTDTNGWKIKGIESWEKVVDNSLPVPYNNAVKVTTQAAERNIMYISIPAFLVKGKTLKIWIVYKKLYEALDDAFQIAYNFTEEDPSTLNRIGDFLIQKKYTAYSTTIKVPSDAEYCHLGIYMGGFAGSYNIKAFDVIPYSGKINPQIALD